MTAPRVYTYSDAIEAMAEFLRGHGTSGQVKGVISRAVQDAYDEVATAHEWTFLFRDTRIQLRKPQTTGTIAYSASTGEFTLTGATWPTDWTVDASVRLADPPIVCDIAERVSDAVATAELTTAPTADITSTTYTLYPRWYRLPNDFLSLEARTMEEASICLGQYVHPSDIAELTRYFSNTGLVRRFSIISPPDLYGAKALFPWPPADSDRTLALFYRAAPRPLRYGADEHAGTISLTSESATVTGASTAFSTGHQGSILRIGSDGTHQPSGLEGMYPYAEQHSITAVAAANSLTMDAVAAATRSAVRYLITDPIDLGWVAWSAFLACAEKNLGQLRNLKNTGELASRYREALARAKGADNPFRETVQIDPVPLRRLRLRDTATNRPLLE